MSKLRMLVGMLCVTVLLFGLWGRAEAQPVSSDPTDPYVKSLLSALTGLVDENLTHVRYQNDEPRPSHQHASSQPSNADNQLRNQEKQALQQQ